MEQQKPRQNPVKGKEPPHKVPSKGAVQSPPPRGAAPKNSPRQTPPTKRSTPQSQTSPSKTGKPPVGRGMPGQGSKRPAEPAVKGRTAAKVQTVPEKKAKEPQKPKAPRQKFSIEKVPVLGWLSKRKKKILEEERAKDDIPENMIRVRGGIDRPMLIIILLLLCYGSVMVFSSSYAYALSDLNDSYYYIRRQIIFVVIGLVAMVLVSHFDYKVVQKFTPLYFVGCLGLMLAVLAVGISEGDAQRWIYIGSISIQPSELMKLGLVMMLAWYYHKMDRLVKTKLFWRSSTFGTFIPIAIVAAVCVLIILENHFSGTIIMFAIGMLVIFAAGGKWLWYILGVAGFGGIVTVLIFATDYASKRIDIWLHPENYSTQGEVWQTLQGLYAIGSGGVLGVGLGNSTQKHLFVSQPQNDFIYSIICEELGLLGAVLVIGLFMAFVWRGIKIAQNTPDVFSRLTVIGIVCQVGIQAMLNIAVVTGTIPNTGITLPFFSYGGSSLTILLAEMGILLGISRYSYQQK